jgi:lipoate-protein ligase A
LAADEYLMRQWRGPDDEFDASLRLYTYRSHCVVVGRFQDLVAEVRVSECERLGVTFNRRPTGGGAILMGADQLGVALTFAPDRADLPARPAALFQHLVEGVSAGLRRLGIEARFRPKNDLEADGRKIAGLGLCRDAGGGLLFHTSLLVDLDVPLMLRVLNIPPEKVTDKLIRHVADRTTTVRRELGRDVALDDVRAEVANGYSTSFQADLVPRSFDESELLAIRELESSRYATDEWVFQRGLSASDGDPRQLSRTALGGGCFGPRSNGVGVAVHKTPAGLLRVYVALSGESTIKSALVTGDFFADPASLARFEARLKWAPATRSSVESAAVAELDPDGITHLDHKDLVDVICRAVDYARRQWRRTA